MLDSNDECGYFVGATMKGMICLYKVKNPDMPTIESCLLEWSSSIANLLKQKT